VLGYASQNPFVMFDPTADGAGVDDKKKKKKNRDYVQVAGADAGEGDNDRERLELKKEHRDWMPQSKKAPIGARVDKIIADEDQAEMERQRVRASEPGREEV